MKWIGYRLLLAALLGVFSPGSQHLYSHDSSSKRSEGLRFSHRFHLTQAKATCSDCHPTAWRSTASEENNLPSEKSCRQCHDGVKARNECQLCHPHPGNSHPVPMPARSYRFNHQLHLELGNLAPAIAASIDSGQYLSEAQGIRKQLDTEDSCVACHRGLEKSDFTSAANLPQMADCLVCHAEIEPPFSCEFCHTKQARIKPASHTPDYLDWHTNETAKLDKQSCKICHGSRFRCMGCH
jgi:c(7)-type cytochrome triheme protein